MYGSITVDDLFVRLRNRSVQPASESGRICLYLHSHPLMPNPSPVSPKISRVEFLLIWKGDDIPPDDGVEPESPGYSPSSHGTRRGALC